MIVHAPLTELLRCIEPVLAQLTMTVTPQCEELLANNRYSPRYAWMFSFEKKLKTRIEEALGRPMGGVERLVFGTDGVVSEGLSNAFVHGHKRDPTAPIQVSCWIGAQGLVFSIADRGRGFDVPELMNRMIQGTPYFNLAGNGLRALAETPGVEASFGRGGSELNIKLPLDQPRGA